VLKEQYLLASYFANYILLTKQDYFDNPNNFYAILTVLHNMLEDKDFAVIYFIVDAIKELCANADYSLLKVGLSLFSNKQGLEDLFSFIAITSKALSYLYKIK